MTTMRIILLAVLCISAVLCYEKSYDGYELIEVKAASKADRNLVIQLEKLFPELDFWYRGPEVVHVLVAPQRLSDVRNFLDGNGLKHRVINDHVQRDIEEEEKNLHNKNKGTRVFNIDDYNTYEDIIAELNSLVTRCRADLGVNCETYTIGQTIEGRDLVILRIWRSGTGRKAVWIDATTHAREWLGTATHLKIATHLVDDYATDAQVQSLVDTYDFYLLPVVNPDGYSYTWSDDRLWRKNRSPNDGSTCFGTDLNRNYDAEWGNAGTSTLPCSETYGGTSAASELEIQAIQNEVVRLIPSLITSVHLHTYAQDWLIPWGCYDTDGVTCKIATDHDEMMVVANAAADAVENTFGTVWARGNSCLVLYPASGMATDYFKASGGIKYTATPELRGNSFVAAPSQIQPSFEEIWNGITTAISTIAAQP